MKRSKLLKYILGTTIVLLSGTHLLFAQVEGGSASVYWDFNYNIPSNWKGEGLALSDDHYKVGCNSIRWNWERGQEVIIDYPQNINASFLLEKSVKNMSGDYEVQKVGGLMCWIYNEKAVDDYLQVEFGKGQKKAYVFPFYLNYTGWRACWVRFSEMEQLVKVNKLDYMKFVAPVEFNSGTLFFDRITFNGSPIHSRSTPDQQLPFINPLVNYNHWGGQWYWETTYKYDIELEQTINAKEKKDFRQIEKRLKDMFIGLVPSQDENWYYKDNFSDMCIVRDSDGGVSGRPIVSDDEFNAFLNDLKPKHLGPVFYGLARGYILTDDDQCKEMFLDLFDHFIDQGYDFGSGTGTQHHFGYQMERIPESFYLMKEVLKETGRLETATNMLSYWYGIAECRIDKKVQELQGVADLWNTKILPRLIAILLMEDSPEKVRDMKSMVRLLDNSLQYSTGTVGGIMPDGSLFHHAGLYPAYMVGALAGVSPVVYALSGTNFQVGTDAVHNLVQSTLLVFNFSNRYDWALSLDGRHPFAGKISQKFIEGMSYLAQTGENGFLNKELASAYMHLASPLERSYNMFSKQGIKPNDKREMFTPVNYGCLGLHRRANWLVTVRGYSKYVWSGEIYQNDNRWGRYMSYGAVQINNCGDPINSKSSGYVQDGWNWNRFPGTTAINLPLEKLYCPTRIMMSRSDESFCGSSSLEGKNGIFGMKLHEYRQLTNFTPDHRARKSVFCFDDLIVCLGSDIENTNAEYPTETTLFQLEATTDSVVNIDGKDKSGLFSKQLDIKKRHILDDNKGNRYFIPKKQKLNIARQLQHSKHNKSERDTEGTFVSAWFNHGKSPKNESYEYAIVVNGQQSKIKPEYTVLQKDKNAHIVQDKQTGITGFVLFEAGKVKHDLVRYVDHESLVMVKKTDDMLLLSLCSPSVNLGNSKSYDDKGSIPIFVNLELDGNWKLLQDYTDVKVVQYKKNKTYLQFECVDGKTIELQLEKK